MQADALNLFSIGEGIAYGSSLINYVVSGAPVAAFKVELSGAEALDHARALLDAQRSDQALAEAKALAAERTEALARALGDLPAEQRNCIVLFDVEGYDYAEIAAIMRVEVGTVKSRIHRGRLALRQALAPDRELFRG